jgi:hypothetical protein
VFKQKACNTQHFPQHQPEFGHGCVLEDGHHKGVALFTLGELGIDKFIGCGAFDLHGGAVQQKRKFTQFGMGDGANANRAGFCSWAEMARRSSLAVSVADSPASCGVGSA